MANRRTGRKNPVIIPPDISFADFLTAHVRTRTGQYSFAGRKPLLEIAEALADPDIPRVDILKGTQIGLTTLAGFGFALWETATRGRNVGYFLPTDKMARELAGERLRYAAGEELAAALSASAGDGVIRVSRGKATARIYVRGLFSILGALSVPLDVNLYDEVDDLDREHFLWARQRLDGSSYAREIAFACGRHPGEGMDARFQEGTQCHWHLKCPSCGRDDQIPELLFPNNVRPVRGTWRIVCVACGSPLDVERDGRWVEHLPDRKSLGVSFRISALVIPALRLGRIMREWDAAGREQRLLAPFRCSKLALPDAADRQALTAEDLARAVGDRPAQMTPLYVGVDIGDWCHVAMATISDTDKINYVRFERVRGDDLIERLRSLNEACRFSGLLVDQRPEGALARNVCRTFPSISWLQQFTSSDKEKTKDLAGESFRVLAFDREETLGEWCDLVKRTPPCIRFPKLVARPDGAPVSFMESDVARQILAGAQRVEAPDATGNTVYRFRWGAVENHFFMACVFAWRIAGRVRGRRVSPREIGLVGMRTTREL